VNAGVHIICRANRAQPGARMPFRWECETRPPMVARSESAWSRGLELGIRVGPPGGRA
jgi:hypothetical protein